MWLSRTLTLAVSAVAQAAAVIVMHAVFVTTLTGRYVDTASITGSRIGFARIADLVYGVLDVVSVVSALAAIVLVTGVALVRRRLVLAAAVAVMVVGANLTTQVLKRLALERPEMPVMVPGAVSGSAENTLPSGHTTVALSVAVAAVLVVPARARGVVAAFATGYAALTGVGTLSARWHRPSDVIAACLVVGAWVAAAGAVSVVLSRRTQRRRTPRSRSLPLLSLCSAGFLALGGLALLATAATEPAELHRTGLFVAYAGGAAGIVGACAGVVAGVLAIAPWTTDGAMDVGHGRSGGPTQPAQFLGERRPPAAASRQQPR